MTKEERIDKIYAQALVFYEGNTQSADDWMAQENLALGLKKPVDMSDSDHEMNLAIELLLGMEWGNFS